MALLAEGEKRPLGIYKHCLYEPIGNVKYQCGHTTIDTAQVRDTYLTLNDAPNIRPPLVKVWVSSIDRSFVARSIIYSGT
jgi:hypothetical protein